MNRKDNSPLLQKTLEQIQEKKITSAKEFSDPLKKELEETKDYDNDLVELLLGFDLEKSN